LNGKEHFETLIGYVMQGEETNKKYNAYNKAHPHLVMSFLERMHRHGLEKIVIDAIGNQMGATARADMVALLAKI
jgi:hypothetical protein